MTAAIATALCGVFLAGSVATFSAALCLYERAKRAAARGAELADQAEAKLREAKAERAKAEAIHAQCGQNTVIRTHGRGPFTLVPGGRA